MRMVAINGSPRQGGSTAKGLEAMIATAEEKGFEVERIDLYDLQFSDCRGCRECSHTGACILDDDMTGIYQKIIAADHLLLASPIYMGSETGTFNCFIDRLFAFMEPQVGGGFKSRIPAGKAATAMLVCGSPDGHIIYHYLTNRFTSILKGMLGIEDFSAFIVPGMNKNPDVSASINFKQNMETFKERL